MGGWLTPEIAFAVTNMLALAAYAMRLETRLTRLETTLEMMRRDVRTSITRS